MDRGRLHTGEDFSGPTDFLCKPGRPRLCRHTGVSDAQEALDRTTPAMAAGVTERLWEVEDLVGLLED